MVIMDKRQQDNKFNKRRGGRAENYLLRVE